MGGAQTWHVLFIMIGSMAYVGDEDDYRFYYYLNYIVNTRLFEKSYYKIFVFFLGKLKLSNCQLHDVKKKLKFRS